MRLAAKQAARMVTDITNETEAALRAIIATAIRQGIPPYDAAKLIKGLVGLTSAQGQAAINYREKLIDSGLSIDKVDAEVEQYSADLLDQRAETITRTEVMDALNEGQDEAWQQAQDEGLLTEDATKEWITTDDDVLCPECEAMDGQSVPIGDDFEDGGPPLHPRCRCTTGIQTP